MNAMHVTKVIKDLKANETCEVKILLCNHYDQNSKDECNLCG